jgi:hypothetical protein
MGRWTIGHPRNGSVLRIHKGGGERVPRSPASAAAAAALGGKTTNRALGEGRQTTAMWASSSSACHSFFISLRAGSPGPVSSVKSGLIGHDQPGRCGAKLFLRTSPQTI